MERIIIETGEIVDNGLHEVYVNTKIDDNSDVAVLMKIFKSTEIAKDSSFPNICKTIKEFKERKREYV